MLPEIIEKIMFSINILILLGSVYSICIVKKGTEEYIVSWLSLIIALAFILLFIIYKKFIVRYLKK